MAAAIEVRQRLEAVPAVPRALHVAEGAGDPLRPHPVRAFMALDDIDFDVEQGTTVGILGHNGSGKSTLLKCVAGILQPTPGEIVHRGRIAALLELGAGFHPELTGRENVFMNASILGLSKTRHRADRSTRSSPSPSSRSSSTCRCATTRRACTCGSASRSRSTSTPTSCSSTRCCRSATRRSSASASSGSKQFQTRGSHDPVRHARGRPRAPHLRPRARARPRQDGRRRAAGRSGAHVPRDVAALGARRPERGSSRSGRGRRSGPTAETPVVVASLAATATNRVRITNVAIEHPGALVGRQWLLPDEAMTIRVAYHADEPHRRPAVRHRRSTTKTATRSSARTPKILGVRRAGRRRRRRDDVRLRARAAARRHLSRDPRDPVDRRGHRATTGATSSTSSR